jgi:hypothetical protein
VWHLSEELSDSTGQANTLTPSGTAVGVGQIADARYFDGVDDRLEVTPTTGLNLGSAMTLEAWVFADDLSNTWYGIFGKRPDDGLRGYSIAAMDGLLVFGKTGVFSVVGDVQVPIMSWHHVAATWDPQSGEVKYYLDGGLGSTIVDANELNAPVAADPVRIGSGSWTNYWDGRIDEVRISDMVRSSAWLAAQHASMTDTFLAFGPAETL